MYTKQKPNKFLKITPQKSLPPYPIWNEAKFFAPPGTTQLTLKVFDDDKGRDDLIAQVNVPYPIQQGRYDLGVSSKGKKNGTFIVSDMVKVKQTVKELVDGCDDIKVFMKIRKELGE